MTSNKTKEEKEYMSEVKIIGSVDEENVINTSQLGGSSSEAAKEAMKERKEKEVQNEKRNYNFLSEAYKFSSSLRKSGHMKLSELLFEESLRAYLSSGMVSSSIGRDKFKLSLEDAYYSSIKVVQFLKFIDGVGIETEGYESFLESAEIMVRTMKAAVNTVNKGRKEAASVKF